jgi:hypothetical protein
MRLRRLPNFQLIQPISGVTSENKVQIMQNLDVKQHLAVADHGKVYFGSDSYLE